MRVTSCNNCPLAAFEADYGDAVTCKHPDLVGDPNKKPVYDEVSNSFTDHTPPPVFCPLRNARLIISFTKKH